MSAKPKIRFYPGSTLKILSVALICLISALISAANARPAGDLEKKQLILLLESLNKAAERKDSLPFVNAMPPQLYKEMAVRLHVDEPLLRRELQQSLLKQFSSLEGRGYVFDNSAIRYTEHKSGILYALIPTRVETNKTITEFMTPAVFDETSWHLIYGGQKTLQNPVFAEIYPDMASVILPNTQIINK